ncbi:MAG: hypothetical protein ABI432_09565 [Flavobacteriales bacterium]
MAAAEDSLQHKGGKGTRFPVYRMLADGRHFYRIEGRTRFTEIQLVGARSVVHHVDATAYPEQLRVQDMIDGHRGSYLPLEAEEWERRWAAI